MLKHRRSRKGRDCAKEDKQRWENTNFTLFPLTSSGFVDSEEIVAGKKYYKMTTNGLSTFYVVTPVNSKTQTKERAIIGQTLEFDKRDETSSTVIKKTKSKSLHLWTIDDVISWLHYLSLSLRECYETHIRSHAVTGRVLARLNEDNLKLIGVENASDRKKILLNVWLLKMRQDLHVIKRNYPELERS